MFSLVVRYTFRNLWRQRGYNLIIVSCLTCAFAAAFFILVWVNFELSYDRFHPDHDRLYRLSYEYRVNDHLSHFARSPQDWVLYLEDFFPEIEEVIRVVPMRTVSVAIEDRKFYTSSFYLADSSYFNVFGYELLAGHPDEVLQEPKSVVISESLARSYFGDKDPVGRSIFAGHQWDTVRSIYTVRGIMKDYPANSHCHFDMVGSIDDPKTHQGWSFNYVKLKEGADHEKVLEKFPDFLGERLSEEDAGHYTPHLQLVRDIHLYSDKDREIEPNGKALYVWIFAIVAVLLLTISFLNYTNLQLAAINRKLGFIHLNRIVGARIRNVLQFIAFEVFLNNLLAVMLGILIMLTLLPVFNRIFGYKIAVDRFWLWLEIGGLSMFLLMVGLVLGTWPVFVLRSRERLSRAGGDIFYRKGFNLLRDQRGLTTRTAMVIGQFLISLVLIFSTLLIYLQVQYMQRGGIGSGDDSILVLKNLPSPVLDNYTLFKEQLLKNPLILQVSASMEEPSADIMDAMHYELEGRNDPENENFINVNPVDPDFLDFYDIPIIAGRNFPDYQGMEAPEYYIINETACKKLGFDSPEDAIGKQFRLVFQWQEIFSGGQIIGVSEDFHFHSMSKPVKPLVMFQKHIWFWTFLIRVDREQFADAVNYIGDTWEEINPDYPFQYHFVDDLYAALYRNEITQARVLVLFTFLTVMIAFLGLTGLMSYLTEARTKEIGIRKVAGASTLRILFQLGKRFLLWILVAMVIAIPLTWWGLNTYWLQNFVYRVEADWTLFIPAGAGVILLAALVISFQTLNAARRNPAESLRYE